VEQALILARDPSERLEKAVRPEQLEALFDAHYLRLYRLARRLSGDAEEARDLVQQAFLRAARRPHRLPEEAARREAWLVRALVNLCRDRWRRLRVRREAADSLPTPARSSDPEVRAVARATVQRALARLSPRRRAVIVLHELEGRDTGEIAPLLGVARVTVRWHLNAARKELRAMLMEERVSPSGGRDG
jgi:RNA polymerase sigma-70 factor (ECF subfamily)